MADDFIVYNDLPTTKDLLEWHDEVERAAHRVKSCHPPHVVGIHGDWGSGKTSFMRQVQRMLGSDMPTGSTVDADSSVLDERERRTLQKQYITVWFDAWRYQNEAVPIVALLQEMRRQMSLIPSVKQRLKKLGAVTVYGILDGLADIGKALGLEGLPNAEKIEKRGEQWERDNFENTIASTSIREHLCQTIACLLPTPNARVVVFIDDLDRCNPKAAIRLLEGLKIYLSIPSCVFVLGMNERILVDAIRDEISAPSAISAHELTLRASHYLEKICSDIYRLPPPVSPLALFSKWLPNTPQRMALFSAASGIECLPPNPRRLKALANQWTRFASRVPFPTTVQEQNHWAVQLLVVSYIYQSHRDLWERLLFNVNFWDEIQGWCAAGGQVLPGEQKPIWALSLQMMFSPSGFDEVTSEPIFKSVFPNPGDIDNFWIGALVLKYKDQLTPTDIMPFVKGGANGQ